MIMIMIMMVMRVGEISAVTAFRYNSLLRAFLLGWLVFDEWLTALTFLGVVIVQQSDCTHCIGYPSFQSWDENIY